MARGHVAARLREPRTIALVLALAMLLAAAPRVTANIGCRLYESREGGPCPLLVGQPERALGEVRGRRLSIRRIEADAPAGTIVAVSDCHPSWYGRSRTRTLHVAVAVAVAV